MGKSVKGWKRVSVNAWKRKCVEAVTLLPFFALTLLLITALTLIPLYPSTLFAADIKNTVAKQSGNRVLFEFDVIGDEAEADVWVSIKIKGETWTSDKLHLEGDFGKVKTGKGKKIYWNVLQDFPRGYSGELKWEILAGAKTFKDPTTGMEFVFVKGGCFQMGDTFGDGGSSEKPVHEVCVDDIYIGKYEVTQKQWQDVMGNNPSYFKNCDNCPVETVSWDDTQEFINKLNQKLAGAGLKPAPAFRLPTEVEWEYAARSGGKNEKYAGFLNENELYLYANFCDSNCEYDLKIKNQNDGYKNTSPVGKFKPNGLGLYDMSGNVWEWVQDWYGDNYYKNSPKDNPKGPDSGQYRVLRGGSWGDPPRRARSAYRGRGNPDYRDNFLGFRCVMTK